MIFREPAFAEASIENAIATKMNFVVCLQLPECPHCDEYAPVFDSLSENYIGYMFIRTIAEHRSQLKRKYLRVDKGEKMQAPCTLVFETGELKRKHFGKMTREQMADFIEGREVQPLKQKTLSDLAIQELHELLCKQKLQRADTDRAIASIEWEISKR